MTGPFPKGHIEEDENAERAMIREVKEETGLDVRVRTPAPPIITTLPRARAR